jgi:hypothetical protein
MSQLSQKKITLLIEKHIIDWTSEHLSLYEFETFNSFNIYTKNKQLEVLNEMIIELNDRINERNGYPFVAHNFDDGIFKYDFSFDNSFDFDTQEYQEMIRLDVQNRLDDILVENVFKSDNLPYVVKFYRKLQENYSEGKKLELLLFKRKEISSNNYEKLDIDFSDSKGTEKIIMLHKLGVLDFLRTKEPFNLSINSLATALSGITGIDTKTIQSYINPIYSNSTNQKNNPLNSIKTVDKVEQKLISIGFKPFK